MSNPPSPVHIESPVEGYASPPSRRTRTVAIVKTHALEYSWEIESRMAEAGFEIIKERQIEFDIESDPDTMYELFGEDYFCFAEGPVRVFVLERRRAVQVWKTLMGPSDPEIAKQEAPNSIRALFGISHDQNAVMGSPDEETAEIQIMSIFASSPPLPSVELPDIGSDTYVSDAYLSESDTHVANESIHSRSSRGTARAKSTSTENGKPKFQARPLPITHDSPDIVPRLSRAAALRMGVVDTAVQPKRFPATPESIARTFAGVPGHKRAETIPVASTAPPAVPPRMTRAASLRLGQPVEPTALKPKGIAKTKSAGATPSDTFEGVPGHKRRESISVASTKPPAVQPRTNRSAELRVNKEAAPPPSSFNFRQSSTLSRASSRNSLDGGRPPTRPASAASVNGNGTPRPMSRTTSRLSTNGKSLNGSSEADKTDGDAPAKPKARHSIAAPPTIVPRTNKSAALRAARMSLGSAGLPANGSATKSSAVKKTASAPAPRTVKA